MTAVSSAPPMIRMAEVDKYFGPLKKPAAKIPPDDGQD